MTTWVGFLTNSVGSVNGLKADDLSPVIILILYATFSFVLVYSAFADCVELYRSLYLGNRRLVRSPIVKIPINVTQTPTTSYGAFTRGDKPPNSTLSVAAKLSCSVKSFDDGRNFKETAFGTHGYYTGSSNYSDQSYKSRIVGGGSGRSNNVKATLTRSTFQGMECEVDKAVGIERPHTVKSSHKVVSMQDDYQDPTRFREIRHGNDCDVSSLKVNHTLKHLPAKNIRTEQNGCRETLNSSNVFSKEQKTHQPVKPSTPSSLLVPSKKVATAYSKSTYAVLIGDSVKVCSTHNFAALPNHNKFLVKERIQDLSGVTRVKLTLKSAEKKERYTHSIPFMHMATHRFAESCILAIANHINCTSLYACIHLP